MADSNANISHSRPVTPDTRFQLQKEAASQLYSDVHDWQTRILFVKPGPYGAPLVAELHEVDLLHGAGVVLSAGKRRRVEYTALSYCWGLPHFVKDIECNGVMFPITENLFDGIQRLRLAEDTLAIWIDALCINQHDTEERSMQISNILTIYSKATEVVVWLGNASLELSIALQQLREGKYAGKYVREAENSADSHVARDLSEGEAIDEDIVAKKSLPKDGVEDEVDLGIRELLENPWWKRVWVRQEVFAAQTLYLQSGQEKLLWDSVHNTLLHHLPHFMRRTPAIKFHIEQGERRNFYLEENKDKFETDLDVDIINVLRRSSGCEASDLRDCVYGVLGMSRTEVAVSKSPKSSYPFPVDYGKTVSEVFQDLARYIMKRDGCLNILLLTGQFGQTVDSHQLPSWTPDFRLQTSAFPWLEYATYKTGWREWLGWTSRPYDVGKEDAGCVEGECPFLETDDKSVLILQGFILGHIEASPSREEEHFVLQIAIKENHRDFFQEVAKSLSIECDYASDLTTSGFRVRDYINSSLAEIEVSDAIDILKHKNDFRLLVPEWPEVHDSCIVSTIVPMNFLHTVKMSPVPVGSLAMKHWSRDKKAFSKYGRRGYEFFSRFAAHREWPMLPGTKTIDLAFESDMLRGLLPTDELKERIVCLKRKSYTSTSRLRRIMEKPLRRWKPRTWVVPVDAKVGDAVVFVKGGLMPMVIRQVSGDSRYRLVGPAALADWAFSHGYEDGYQKYLPSDNELLHEAILETQYDLWLRLLRIHDEDKRLDTFHLV